LGHTDALRSLLRNGFEVNERTEMGDLAIELASGRGHVGTVALLLDSESRKEDALALALEGACLIEAAGSREYEDFVRTIAVLVRSGAETNVRLKSGDTLLHLAVSLGNADVVRLLMRHGADPNAMDSLGKTPIDLAREYDDDGLILVMSRYR
jgi:ankyrin repeat protein